MTWRVVQIAGLIARRILCDVREGQHVVAGSRFGIIRFGQPHGCLSAGRHASAGGGGADHDRRRDGDRRRGETAVSGLGSYRRRQRRRPRFSGPSFNRIVPNLMTLLGLCAGLTSMRFALDERWGDAAVARWWWRGAIDGLDGRLARLLKATSRFGAEFDSLADFLCFGVAPAFILYLWSLHVAGGYGFTPCLMFAVCMALRLARFNSMIEASPAPAYAQSFFTGVPAPAGAGLALFPLFAGLEAHEWGWQHVYAVVQHPLFCAAVLVGTAALLVSTLPVWSFKNFQRCRRSMCCRCCWGRGCLPRCWWRTLGRRWRWQG